MPSLLMINNNNQVCEYDEKSTLFNVVTRLPDWCDEWTQFSAFRSDHLVILGAFRYEKGCEIKVINLPKREIRHVINLPDSTTGAGLTILKDELYVVGGERHTYCWLWVKSNILYCVNLIGQPERRRLADMMHPVLWPLVVNDGRTIYALGGQTTTSRETKLVQRYDTETCHWEVCQDLPLACNAQTSGAVVYKNQLVVITCTHVMTCNLGTQAWSKQKHDLALGATVVGALVHGGVVLVNAEKNGGHLYEFNVKTATSKKIDLKVSTKEARYIFA